MHGLKHRVDANSLCLLPTPFAKPGIVFSTFGKLILREPVVYKRKTGFKKKSKREALVHKKSLCFKMCFAPAFVEHAES